MVIRDKPAIKGYKLLELIGEGAYGAVYRARQPVVDRQVAVNGEQISNFATTHDSIYISISVSPTGERKINVEHNGVAKAWDFAPGV